MRSRSVTLPPIVFAQYINPDPATDALSASVLSICFCVLVSGLTYFVAELAIVRAVMIAAGIVAALIVNSVLFPRHCRVCGLYMFRAGPSERAHSRYATQVLFLSDTSRTLGLLSSLYLTLSQ